MRKLALALILAICLTVTNNALAQVQTQPAGQGPTGHTASGVSVGTSSTTVTLTAPSNYITIVNPSTSAIIYFSPVSPATSSSFPIGNGSTAAAWTYSGVPLSTFYLLSSSGTVTVGIDGH